MQFGTHDWFLGHQNQRFFENSLKHKDFLENSDALFACVQENQCFLSCPFFLS